MTRKEFTEIRRRLKPEASAVTQFYGCYVNGLHQIISMFSVSAATMSETECGMYFDLIRKAVSGTTGKNLITVQMERESSERQLLNDMRAFGEKDAELRERFFRQVIEHADMEGNYLILLAHDSYDVPFRSSSGEADQGASAAVFRYFICAVCPVLDAEAKLAYQSEEREFRSGTAGQTVGMPAAGFMYPSFAGRSANLDRAVYYMKTPADPHDALAEGLFGTKRPMTDAERRDVFREALGEAVDGTCDLATVQTLYQAMRDRDELIRTSENPEMDMLRPGDLQDILEESGMDGKKAEKLAASYGEAMEGSRVMPDAVLDHGQFRMITPEVKITADPELVSRIRIRTIEGRRYILIPAGDGVEVNGISVF